MDPDPAWQPGTPAELPFSSSSTFEPLALAVPFGLFVLLLLVYIMTTGVKVALASLDKSSRDVLARSGEASDAAILTLLADARRIVAGLVVQGLTVALAAAFQAVIVAERLVQYTAIDASFVYAAVFLVAAGLFVGFGEAWIRVAASRNPVLVGRRTYPAAVTARLIFRPLAHRLRGAFTPSTSDHAPSALAHELRTMADIGQAHGTLEPDERELIYSIVEFTETTVREAMVSRVDMVALPVTATLSEALQIIRTSGHSRLPLYEENLDHILGIVYAKDLLPYLTAKNRVETVDWMRISRTPMLVPTGKMLDDLLKDFQTRNTHMAIVVDEYGGTAGLITLENVLEEIVGDIRDEHDVSEPPVCKRIDDHTFRFDARVNLDEVNEILGTELDTDEFEFETLGGLVFHLAGAVPAVGDTCVYSPLHMRVDEVDNQRIVTVTVTLQREPETVDHTPDEA